MPCRRSVECLAPVGVTETTLERLHGVPRRVDLQDCAPIRIGDQCITIRQSLHVAQRANRVTRCEILDARDAKGSPIDDGIKAGNSISEQAACANLLKCVVTKGCFTKGNNAQLFLPCYCDGLSSNQTQCLSTTPPTGVCAAQYDIGLNINSGTAASLTNLRSTSYPAGVADMLLVCLNSQCASDCL